MSKKRTSLILVIGAILVILVASQVSMRSLSILAVSNVYIDPQFGYEDPQTGEWKGSYWIVLSTTSTYGNHVFYKFDVFEAEKFGKNFVGEDKLLPKATIEVNVYVDQPYTRRALTNTPYTVCKPAYDSYGNPNYYDYSYVAGEWVKKTDGPIPQQDVVLKETAGDWQIVVPLRVSASKTDADGNKVALQSDGQAEVVLEVAGPDALIPLWFENPADSSEKFKFKLEGLLGTGYAVTIPDLAIFADGSITRTFEKTGDLLSSLRYSTSNPASYVQYWYGDKYGSLATDDWYQTADGQSISMRHDPHKGKAWEVSWLTGTMFPRRMWIYDDPPPISGQYYEGLVSYLASNHREMQSWEIDRWGQGYEVSDSEVKVYMPYNSWNWLYTLEISTELADTYVWQPTYADGQITNVEWASTSTKDATISDKDQLEVTVKNIGTVDGNLRVRLTVSPNDAPLLIEGDGKFFTVGEEHTFTIQAKNLGPETETDGNLLLELVNDAGDIRDTDTASFTLLPITGVTTLNVKLEEQGNPDVSLSGLIVSVQYGADSQSQVCSGGWASFSMGAHQGGVTITVEESMNYYGASKETSVSTGSQVETVTLVKKAAPTPSPDDFDWTPLVWVAVAVVVGVTVLGLAKKRRKHW